MDVKTVCVRMQSVTIAMTVVNGDVDVYVWVVMVVMRCGDGDEYRNVWCWWQWCGENNANAMNVDIATLITNTIITFIFVHLILFMKGKQMKKTVTHKQRYWSRYLQYDFTLTPEN